jgi:hypothetical protein
MNLYRELVVNIFDDDSPQESHLPLKKSSPLAASPKVHSTQLFPLAINVGILFYRTIFVIAHNIHPREANLK